MVHKELEPFGEKILLKLLTTIYHGQIFLFHGGIVFLNLIQFPTREVDGVIHLVFSEFGKILPIVKPEASVCPWNMTFQSSDLGIGA